MDPLGESLGFVFLVREGFHYRGWPSEFTAGSNQIPHAAALPRFVRVGEVSIKIEPDFWPSGAAEFSGFKMFQMGPRSY